MTHEVVAERLGAPEGPVVGPDGWILNVCSFTPEDRTWRTRGGDITATPLAHPRRTRVVFNTSTAEVEGIPASLAFGPDGCLYVTDEGRRAIVRVSPDGTQEDFIVGYAGERLNGPNDLSFDRDGSLFFTDPWGSSLDRRIGAVYGYNWEAGTLHRIRTDMAFPNGIVARDGRLYVAETHTLKLWVHEITDPGRAGPARELCTLPDVATSGWKGPDGIALDDRGNLWVGHLGSGDVLVYEPDGSLVDRVSTGGVRPTNVCFAGDDLRTLLVTVDDLGLLISVPVQVAGARLSFCPSASTDHPWSEPLRRIAEDGDA